MMLLCRLSCLANRQVFQCNFAFSLVSLVTWRYFFLPFLYG
uniref:Uncharacterized protein n=1 Tax=Rhizophora mucronata TaxID=61149 RepID=A0A2P2NQ20_RHIMU